MIWWLVLLITLIAIVCVHILVCCICHRVTAVRRWVLATPFTRDEAASDDDEDEEALKPASALNSQEAGGESGGKALQKGQLIGLTMRRTPVQGVVGAMHKPTRIGVTTASKQRNAMLKANNKNQNTNSKGGSSSNDRAKLKTSPDGGGAGGAIANDDDETNKNVYWYRGGAIGAAAGATNAAGAAMVSTIDGRDLDSLVDEELEEDEEEMLLAMEGGDDFAEEEALRWRSL